MTSTEPTLWDEIDTGDELVPAVVDVGSGGEVAELIHLDERARDYARNSKAANTLRAYEPDLRQFGAWCEAKGLRTFPATAQTVAYYLTDHGGVLAISTLRRRLASISVAHKAARHPNPTADRAVKVVWDGILRRHGKAPEAKEAAVTDVVATMVKKLGESLIDVRDRAILLVGFAGAFRRSELPALDVTDVVETGEGLASRWAGPRPTRRPRARRSASPTARIHRRVRCARGVHGSSAPASRTAPPSGACRTGG